ncbi:restriction endonuclease [Peribacillus frigoritolerans]|uniref:restriction endonuclease n=1 Tax=Peribacillus frigoritolerans TaxID=450367 RepID=UPI0020410A83|nr:restriction endonuclease [Peribacillus frigoritolerans]MCM3167926.1 restriction endonuclease [Peribacillus frigoritolerans]
MAYNYETTIHNSYLGLSKIIKGQTPAEVTMKAQNQMEIWDKRAQRERQKELIQDMKQQAEYDSENALKEINSYKNILNYTLQVDDKVDWDKLYDNESFISFDVTKKKYDIQDFKLSLKIPMPTFWEKIFPKMKMKRLELEEQAKIQYEEAVQKAENEYEDALTIYNKEKAEFDVTKENYNKTIKEFKQKFEEGDSQAVEDYIRLVLENSIYPDAITKEFNVQYNPESEIGIIDYVLPHPSTIPNVIDYKFIQTRKEIVSKEMKKKDFEEFYEDIIYQLTLRTIHELFESVYNKKLQTVVFNGWVQGIDLATGQDFNSCILSVQTTKDEFETINLERVNPKECFRNLKGLSSGALKNLAPVKPILKINREDSRFVESKDILAEVNSIPNLAVMAWDDFEHLVRGLFEKIFAKHGGEVKVTQASRDGGVDAIAFDPDPIRGGKFVIQAKRYNKVVSVSAVRDLYGTMINEGAVKGILVTTSHYGKDSYEFVKDKPITLIDGSNLVHLFNEEGLEVRIEIKR